MRLLLWAMPLAAALAASTPAPLGLDLFRPTPPDNRLTRDKIALGRRLFHDERLSESGTMSCASCHPASRAFTNGRLVVSGPPGVATRRNVPSLINRAYGTSFFWDGRAASLEEQVVQPLLGQAEVGATRERVVDVIGRDRRYRQGFERAFGRPPAFEDVPRALASYVRAIRSGGSRFDRFREGDRSTLNRREQSGLGVFFGKAQCWTCHSGMNLTDERFHNTGVAFRTGPMTDPGRFAVTGREEDRGAFKTPTLRDVALTAPYMHDGSLATLADVVDHYDRGGAPNQALDRLIQPIGLSVEEKLSLVAFLRSLTGRIQDTD